MLLARLPFFPVVAITDAALGRFPRTIMEGDFAGLLSWPTTSGLPPVRSISASDHSILGFASSLAWALAQSSYLCISAGQSGGGGTHPAAVWCWENDVRYHPRDFRSPDGSDTAIYLQPGAEHSAAAGCPPIAASVWIRVNGAMGQQAGSAPDVGGAAAGAGGSDVVFAETARRP